MPGAREDLGTLVLADRPSRSRAEPVEARGCGKLVHFAPSTEVANPERIENEDAEGSDEGRIGRELAVIARIMRRTTRTGVPLAAAAGLSGSSPTGAGYP
jgi:hypothetical protein